MGKGEKNVRTFKCASALALSILIVISQPVAYAKPISVLADRIGDEFIWDNNTRQIIMSVGRRNPLYISFIDLINVRMRTRQDSLLMTWLVLEEIPNTPEDGFINIAYFVWMASTEEGLLLFPYPEDFPWVVVIMGYSTTIDPTEWWSYVIVATSPSDAQQYSLDFTTRKRSLEATIPLSILPFSEFYWMGGTTYQNRNLVDDAKSLHDFATLTYMG